MQEREIKLEWDNCYFEGRVFYTRENDYIRHEFGVINEEVVKIDNVIGTVHVLDEDGEVEFFTKFECCNDGFKNRVYNLAEDEIEGR